MPIFSIIKRALVDSFRRKEECEPGSQDYKNCEETIDTALKAAKRCERETYEEFKDK